MKILVWNIRGFNKSLKHKEVKKILRCNKVSILCLIETKVKESNVRKVKDIICPNWLMVHNYSTNPLGRIWICWDPGFFSMEAFSISEQIISCKVEDVKGQRAWFLSVVYGSNQGLNRKRMLRDLLHDRDFIGNLPWLVVGDFNVIRFPQESSNSLVLTCYEKEFVECINELEVEDVSFTGCYHTWTNKQEGMNFVSKKLDRVLSNLEWLRVFPNTSVEFLERGVSDHSPSIVVIDKIDSFGPKPFKFFNFWAEHKDFLDWVAEGWCIEVEGYSMFQLYTRLKVVKSILKKKNADIFGSLGQRWIVIGKI